MISSKRINFTKSDIALKIQIKTGLSKSYIKEVIDDFINILTYSIKTQQLNIKNFGTFKNINKRERIGRNPKNNKIYKITARKSLSFIPSKTLIKIINNQ